MICYFLVLVTIVLLCSCLAPHSDLRESAVRALDSSVLMVGRFGPPDGEVDDAPRHKEA